MSHETLRELLAKVHQRLEKGGPLDQDARAMLATVTRDIERALNRSGPEAVAQAAASAPRVEALAVQLESEHPALVQVLREITNILSNAGI
jgi:predicted component of type VI protein secretion system